MSAPARPRVFGLDVERVHFAGVGGMGAGPLAIYLAGLGFTVTGEDDALGPEMAAVLAGAGVRVTGFPADAQLLVHSTAIAANHPARRAAEAAGVPRVRRGELLAEITRGRKLIAVCGSHGKTTTTAMLVTAMRRAQFPGGYVLGGLLADGTPPAHPGSNDWVVAEIDESDGTIEQFTPQLTVVVNLDWDHPDHYRQFSELEATFAALLARTRGAVLLNSTCAASSRLREGAATRAAETLTFGPGGDYPSERIADTAGRMTLRLGGRFPLAEAQVHAQGEFNASNATAALAVAHLAGAPLGPQLLADYAGVRRRQTVLEAGAELTAIEDYAHHPAEIRALLASLRTQVPAGGRLLAVFQPHRFSRTAQFRPEFAAALSTADRVYLLDVYPAGEAPVPGGTTAELAADLRGQAPSLAVNHATNDEEFFRVLDADHRAGDWIAFIGAGDVDRRAKAWLARRGAAGARVFWDEHLAALQAGVSASTRLRREEPLAGKTTLRVGGAARIYAEPASLDDLQFLMRTAASRSVAVFPLGRGSNLVVPDSGVDGLVISLAHESWAGFGPQGDGSVRAGAGLRLKNLCGLAAKAGLVGFEFLEGIPGTVGGALRMNAGAMGGWMFDVVEEVQLITLAGEVRTLPKAAMHVDYRHCAELNDAIALSARLRPAAQADVEAVRRQMDAYARKRHESQPREPSAGCIFKNPPGNSAGRLIDESGLKGTRVGDAEVSPVHANFIVNRGHASGADVVELVRRVRARVREAKGVDLMPEVLLYGKRWEDVL